jgi:hypothetical protein
MMRMILLLVAIAVSLLLAPPPSGCCGCGKGGGVLRSHPPILVLCIKKLGCGGGDRVNKHGAAAALASSIGYASLSLAPPTDPSVYDPSYFVTAADGSWSGGGRSLFIVCILYRK